jgi:hypothetical protein
VPEAQSYSPRYASAQRSRSLVYGAFDPPDTITIWEEAFRPISGVGGYPGSWWNLRKLRWEIGNLLRGNLALRVLTHENYHRFQFSRHFHEFVDSYGFPYRFDPREFTIGLPVPWGLGAWDFVMRVPPGAISSGLGGLGLWFLADRGSEEE